MKLKSLLLFTALLLCTAVSAQQSNAERAEQARERAEQARERALENAERALENAEQVRERALEQATRNIDLDVIVKEAIDKVDIEATVARAMSGMGGDTVIVSAERARDPYRYALVRGSGDTVIVRAGRHRVVVVERNDDGSRTEVAYFNERRQDHHGRHARRVVGSMMIDMGFSIYDPHNIFTGEDGGDDFAPQHTSKSFGVAIYPLMGHLRLNRARTLSLTSGLGLDIANYRFEDNYTIANVNGVTIPSQITKYSDNTNAWVVRDLDKSKLTTTYLNMPLMVGLRIPVSYRRSEGIRLETGVIGSLMLGAHTKWKYSSGGKEKDRGSFNLNAVRYQLTARVGYGGLMAFFNYQMNPMFKTDHGPKLYPYQVGISWRFGSMEF